VQVRSNIFSTHYLYSEMEEGEAAVFQCT